MFQFTFQFNSFFTKFASEELENCSIARFVNPSA